MFDSRPPSLSLAGGPAGTAGQLVRLQSDRVLEATPNSADGDVMTMVSGAPDWATPAPTTPDLSKVAVFKAKCTTLASIPDLSSVDLTDIYTFDFTALELNDVVFIKNGASPDGVIVASDAYNGLYVLSTVVGTTGTFTRAPWADTAAKLWGLKIFVAVGSNVGGSTWKLRLPTQAITVDTTLLIFERDDLGISTQHLQSYKPLALSVSTADAVGEAFGGTALSFNQHQFGGTTLHIFWEITYYITSGTLTGEVRLVDKTSNIVRAIFSALKSTDPVTIRSGDIAGSLFDGHAHEIELAITGGSDPEDKIYVDSAFFVIRNTKN